MVLTSGELSGSDLEQEYKEKERGGGENKWFFKKKKRTSLFVQPENRNFIEFQKGFSSA